MQRNREVVSEGLLRSRRDVGSYLSEMDILQSMLNEHSGALRVKFKPSIDLPFVDVGGLLSDEVLQNDSTILLANPKEVRDVKLSVRRRWVDLEEAAQNPTYVWERLTKPQSRMVDDVNESEDAIEEVLELERRGRSIAQNMTFSNRLYAFKMQQERSRLNRGLHRRDASAEEVDHQEIDG